MSAEPQRDLEQDLRAYKQHRDGQLGAPVELHPATRRMLQGEVARTTGRPLLTSEEAAKNFVRSFVMSHQRPGFFTRYRPQILWGGGMAACLALVLLVLRNDPQHVARQSTFTDALPTPSPAANPQAAPSPAADAAKRQLADRESQARAQSVAPSRSGSKDVVSVSVAPTGSSATDNLRRATVVSAPVTLVERQAVARPVSAGSDPTAGKPPELFVNTPVPKSGPEIARQKLGVTRAASDRGAERKYSEQTAAKTEASEIPRLASVEKALKSEPPAGPQPAQTAKAMAGMDKFQAVGGASRRTLAESSAGSVDPPATAAGRTLDYAATVGVSNEALAQRFRQEDARANLRQNYNSPPVPQVMQDFAFQRTGDRVRIFDTDGSTYEGTVLPEPVAEELRAKLGVADLAASEGKAVQRQQLQRAALPEDGTVSGYRFYATGLNRKLNQPVEFRGEWQPVAPASQTVATSASQATSFKVTRLDRFDEELKNKPAVSTLSPAPAQSELQLGQKQATQSPPLGRISGRAVVGGRNEFEVNAVPK